MVTHSITSISPTEDRKPGQHVRQLSVGQRFKARICSILVAFTAIASSWMIYRSYQYDMVSSGSWGCEMSWMTPSYSRIDWEGNPLSRYTLYLYREQGWDTEDSPAGHPVIFIPGNAGSYQQVRSIASSASRQYHGQPGGRAGGMEGIKKLDLFTVDLNEEFSAFDAFTLRQQAAFIRHAIRQTLDMYEHLPPERRPQQVTLLGHSMGGIVARLAVMSDVAELVDVILTMSTPHGLPPVAVEYEMEKIYSDLGAGSGNLAPQPPLISLCGGVSDSQIVSDGCVLSDSIASYNTGFTAFTTGVPGVWTGVDHQAMVWCHQVRWRVARTLLAMTTESTRLAKLSSARNWFLEYGNPGPSSSQRLAVEHVLPITGPETTILLKFSNPGRDSLRLLQCIDGADCLKLDPRTLTVPAPSNRDAPFPLPGEGIKAEDTLTVVHVSLNHTDGHLLLQSDPYSSISTGPSVSRRVSSPSWRYDAGDRTPIHINLNFVNIRMSSLAVYRLNVDVGPCTGSKPIVKHIASSASAIEGTNQEIRYYPNAFGDLRVHSHSVNAPFVSSQAQTGGLKLEIYQTPECPVSSVVIERDIAGSLAKIVIRQRMIAISWPIAWTALVLLQQIDGFTRDNHFPPFDIALEQIGRHWLPKIIAGLCGGAALQSMAGNSIDLSSFLLGSTDIVLVPLVILMALWSFGVVAILRFTMSKVTSGVTLIALLWNPTASGPLYSRLENHSPGPLQRHRTLIISAIVLLFVLLVVPHQLAFVISTCVLWIYTAIPLSLTKDNIDLAESLFTLMFMLLPFKVATLLVWGRGLWMNWKHPFPTNHNILHVIPAVLVVVLCSQGQKIKQRHGLALGFQAAMAFLLGGRYTWILVPMGNIVLLLVAALLW